jgi:hypothetical protein
MDERILIDAVIAPSVKISRNLSSATSHALKIFIFSSTLLFLLYIHLSYGFYPIK